MLLAVWPRARLATMTLDEYSQAGLKDSFTYWIESRLDRLTRPLKRKARMRFTPSPICPRPRSSAG